MGSGRHTDEAYRAFSTARNYDDPSTTPQDIYQERHMHEDLNPRNFDIRESVDGADNPESTPVIIALDITGSMSPVLAQVARDGLRTVCEETYNRKPVSDPHICVLGIGDVLYDIAPLQATQFEADIRIFEQLEKIYLEQHGGGNDFESYIFAWYFAKFMTRTDSFTKRGRKGFLFTVGDEEITPQLRGSDIRRFIGDKGNIRDYTAEELFELICYEWNVFHVIIKQGNYATRFFSGVKASWDAVIGKQKVLPLSNYEALGETIVSAMEVASGRSVQDVGQSWDGERGEVVREAIGDLEDAAIDALDA